MKTSGSSSAELPLLGVFLRRGISTPACLLQARYIVNLDVAGLIGVGSRLPLGPQCAQGCCSAGMSATAWSTTKAAAPPIGTGRAAA